MRRLVLLICCLLITGCNNTQYDEQIKTYNRLINETKELKANDVSKSLAFDIEVYFEKITNDEITYRIIIDNPKEEMLNIKAIAIHNYPTKDIFPTTGLFEEPLNLIPNNIDLKKNNAKGVILIGYIKYNKKVETFKGTIKVLIEYSNKNKTIKRYYQYSEVS